MLHSINPVNQQQKSPVGKTCYPEHISLPYETKTGFRTNAPESLDFHTEISYYASG